MKEKYKLLMERITELKREKKAIILAHNYQRPEVQDIADYVGDSVELSRKAAELEDAKIIVFAAVDFMAEIASILNPDKRILIPTRGARCPMAGMLQPELIIDYRKRYPGVPVVLYVNTLAEAKAECDLCCTSANAVEIVEAFDSDTVIFGPDRNLAEYVAERTGKHIIPIPKEGFCPVHILFSKEEVLRIKEADPKALVLAHPECVHAVREISDYIGSTSQMCRFAKESDAEKMIIATEIGLIHRLRKENPDKTFIPAYEDAVCVNMKLNTLESLYMALKEEKYVVRVPEKLASRAREAVERMFEIIGGHS